MRQVLLAVAIGVLVGGALFAWSRREPTSATAAPQPTSAVPDAPRQADPALARVFESPTRPGLIVTVKRGTEPVSGARVEVLRDDFELARNDRRWRAIGGEQTDEQGHALFPVAAGHFLAFAKDAAGAQAASEFDVAVAGGATEVTLTLGATEKLTGTALAAGTRNPVGGASVEVHLSDRRSVVVARGTADALGRFSLDVPKLDHYWLEGRGPGFLPSGIELASLDKPHDLELTRGAQLEGLVTSADGTPVADATVRLAPGEETWTSDREGRFNALVAPGNVSVHALAVDGRQALTRTATQLDRPARVTLVLEGGNELRGVVHARGAAAVEVHVLAEPDDLEVALITATATATTPGDFAFSAKGLPPGRYSVRAQQGQGRRATAVGLELPGAPAVDLTLAGSGAVRGVVTNGEAPLENVTVELTFARGMNEVPRTARTGPDGAFAFDDLLPAEVGLRAHDGSLVSAEEEVYVAPESVVERNLTLAEQGRLVGQVDGEAEKVMIGGPTSNTRVDVANGRFEALLSPGSYRIYVLEGEVFSDVADATVRAGEITHVMLNTVPMDAGVRKHQLEMHPEVGSGLSFENAAGGVRVDFLMADCPAAKAGVLIGDVVVSIGDEGVRDALDAFAKVRRPAGQALTMQVRRDGKDLLLTLR